jgi:hypothetical protein
LCRCESEPGVGSTFKFATLTPIEMNEVDNSIPSILLPTSPATAIRTSLHCVAQSPNMNLSHLCSISDDTSIRSTNISPISISDKHLLKDKRLFIVDSNQDILTAMQMFANKVNETNIKISTISSMYLWLFNFNTKINFFFDIYLCLFSMLAFDANCF